MARRLVTKATGRAGKIMVVSVDNSKEAVGFTACFKWLYFQFVKWVYARAGILSSNAVMAKRLLDRSNGDLCPGQIGIQNRYSGA